MKRKPVLAATIALAVLLIVAATTAFMLAAWTAPVPQHEKFVHTGFILLGFGVFAAIALSAWEVF